MPIPYLLSCMLRYTSKPNASFDVTSFLTNGREIRIIRPLYCSTDSFQPVHLFIKCNYKVTGSQFLAVGFSNTCARIVAPQLASLPSRQSYQRKRIASSNDQCCLPTIDGENFIFYSLRSRSSASTWYSTIVCPLQNPCDEV
jgi:hypothetical protein